MTAFFLSRLNFEFHPPLFVAGLMAFALPSCLGQARAATSPTPQPSDAPYVATMTFDVASVRENKNVDPQTGYTMSGYFVPHTTTYRVTNWAIENLITTAYGVHQYQIVGAPNWPWPTLFMVEAKGDSEADAKMATLTGEQQWAEQKHMLQVLLE